MAHSDDAIPLVDVGLDEKSAAEKVYKACTESGFFYGTHNCQAGAAAAGPSRHCPYTTNASLN
jgi:hypothetical protein